MKRNGLGSIPVWGWFIVATNFHVLGTTSSADAEFFDHTKVVVLDFWADWCPPCLRMLPHERKLAEDFKGKPFALLGVFVESKPKLQALVDAKSVTWRNWVEGRDSPTGKLWRIVGIPTIYVLDHEGVIRHKAVGVVTASQLEG